MWSFERKHLPQSSALEMIVGRVEKGKGAQRGWERGKVNLCPALHVSENVGFSFAGHAHPHCLLDCVSKHGRVCSEPFVLFFLG